MGQYGEENSRWQEQQVQDPELGQRRICVGTRKEASGAETE